MKALQSLAAVAATSLLASTAFAAVSLGTLVPGGTPSSAPIHGYHTGGLPSFTDEFTFSVNASAAVGSSATSVQLKAFPASYSGVHLSSMELFYHGTGSPLATAAITSGSCGTGCSFQVASLSYMPLLAGGSDWYSIKVGGDTLGFTSGSYGGTVEVSAVPEPHEWAMMLAGLGLVGALAARRRRAAGPAS